MVELLRNVESFMMDKIGCCLCFPQNIYQVNFPHKLLKILNVLPMKKIPFNIFFLNYENYIYNLETKNKKIKRKKKEKKRRRKEKIERGNSN
jgi:hypothetical protein